MSNENKNTWKEVHVRWSCGCKRKKNIWSLNCVSKTWLNMQGELHFDWHCASSVMPKCQPLAWNVSETGQWIIFSVGWGRGEEKRKFARRTSRSAFTPWCLNPGTSYNYTSPVQVLIQSEPNPIQASLLLAAIAACAIQTVHSTKGSLGASADDSELVWKGEWKFDCFYVARNWNETHLNVLNGLNGYHLPMHRWWEITKRCCLILLRTSSLGCD